MYIQLTAGVSTVPVITEETPSKHSRTELLFIAIASVSWNTVQGSGHNLSETSCKSSSSAASGNAGHAVLAGWSTVIFSQSSPSVPTLSVQADSLVLPEV